MTLSSCKCLTDCKRLFRKIISKIVKYLIWTTTIKFCNRLPENYALRLLTESCSNRNFICKPMPRVTFSQKILRKSLSSKMVCLRPSSKMRIVLIFLTAKNLSIYRVTQTRSLTKNTIHTYSWRKGKVVSLQKR